jgi:hypothetical protein
VTGELGKHLLPNDYVFHLRQNLWYLESIIHIIKKKWKYYISSYEYFPAYHFYCYVKNRVPCHRLRSFLLLLLYFPSPSECLLRDTLLSVLTTNAKGIPRFMSLICSSKTARKAKLAKRKLISHYFPTGTTIDLREEGARISENWLINWKTGINLCISYKRKLVNRLLVYRGITV